MLYYFFFASRGAPDSHNPSSPSLQAGYVPQALAASRNDMLSSLFATWVLGVVADVARKPALVAAVDELARSLHHHLLANPERLTA